MDKLLFRRILMIALSVLAVVYAAYLLISTNFKMYPTENAVQTTVTDKIYSNGFIIRDENMIQNNTSGVLSYTVHDGDEVKAGGEIAKSYAMMMTQLHSQKSAHYRNSFPICRHFKKQARPAT